jgi:hypothetical protein
MIVFRAQAVMQSDETAPRLLKRHAPTDTRAKRNIATHR